MSDSKLKTAEDIYAAFLALDEAEQQRLLLLMAERDGAAWNNADIRRAWVAEAERRIRQLDAGQTHTVPVDEALRQVRARIANLRK